MFQQAVSAGSIVMADTAVVIDDDDRLDFKAFIASDAHQESTIYVVFAVIVHSGSARSGHYMIYIKRRGQWCAIRALLSYLCICRNRVDGVHSERVEFAEVQKNTAGLVDKRKTGGKPIVLEHALM